ncbi:hypothetical protein L226DRAFT_541071 [Lentinus tigrinus ALCF2SS1-7]|uniref:uncharacterized protein n=1 Tax=Lentinus tigrinus ALCF2SS1-7 TaxID=1328758 RepID=UPI001165CD66|nr:hypothetical protein L226DRAFT_541071 [Lentinus tigrinus ALCF2SS1-7]
MGVLATPGSTMLVPSDIYSAAKSTSSEPGMLCSHHDHSHSFAHSMPFIHIVWSLSISTTRAASSVVEQG